MAWLIELALILITLFLIFSLWFNRNHSFFKKHNLPYVPPAKFFGSLKEMIMFKTTPTHHFSDLYNHESAKNQPFVGIFILHKPGILLRDPKLIRQIFVKDFNYFSNRGSAASPSHDPLGAYNLFFVKNPAWKTIRSNLTSFFSSGKLKQMFHLVNEAATELDKLLSSLSDNKDKKFIGLDFKDLNARYTTDVIASVAFGVTANSIKDPNAEFRQNGRPIVDFSWGRAAEFSSIFLLPEIVPYIKSKLFSDKSTAFLREAITFVMKERIRTGERRQDLIDILIAAP